MTTTSQLLRSRAPRNPGRPGDAAFLLALLAALSVAATVAGVVMHQRNLGRAARYGSDASCRLPLADRTGAAQEQGACSVESATVAAHWAYRSRGTYRYRLALRTPDGELDSVELKGGQRRTAWEAAPLGAELVVRRYADSLSDRRHHVVETRADTSQVRTEWNPSWRNDDAAFGTVAFALMSAVWLIALTVSVRRRVRRSRAPVPN